MSDKPRVYQGVRVKTTVKELLQRHRAREANSKKLKTISQTCLELQELCASTFPSRYQDLPPAAPAAASFPLADSGSCSIQMQEGAFSDIQQQFVNDRMPSCGGYCGGGGVEGGYSGSLSPPAALPAPWSHGLSSDEDYYGPGTAPCSPPKSLKFCNPMDPNSYSPQDSFSCSSSSCYDSPTRMDSSYGGYASEHFHYQHCSLQDCYCLPHCWPAQQESFPGPECAPYYGPTDYGWACPAEESYFRRDLQMSSDMCYNVL